MPKYASPSTAIYDLDYFDPCQMFLYIGDVWVDEITSISYEDSENKTPIYGYASQLFDDLAAGQCLVQGNFTINFKEQGYLWAVLKRFKGMSLSDYSTKAEKALGNAGKTSPIVWSGNNHTGITRENIERVTQGKATRGEEFQFYHDLAGYATSSPKMKGKAKDTTFAGLMDAFEDQVWRNGVSNEDLLKQIRKPTNTVFNGFDMFLVFGNYSSQEPNHTVLKFINVSLLSQGKTIRMSEGPIQEQYSFLAQVTL